MASINHIDDLQPAQPIGLVKWSSFNEGSEMEAHIFFYITFPFVEIYLPFVLMFPELMESYLESLKINLINLSTAKGWLKNILLFYCPYPTTYSCLRVLIFPTGKRRSSNMFMEVGTGHLIKGSEEERGRILGEHMKVCTNYLKNEYKIY